jgi:hypothetical protein
MIGGGHPPNVRLDPEQTFHNNGYALQLSFIENSVTFDGRASPCE